jgi:hypothetical protein
MRKCAVCSSGTLGRLGGIGRQAPATAAGLGL